MTHQLTKPLPASQNNTGRSMVGVAARVHPPSWFRESPYPLGGPFKPTNGTKLLLLRLMRNQPHLLVVHLTFNSSYRTLRRQQSAWFEMLALGMAEDTAKVRLVSGSSQAQQAKVQASPATTAGAAGASPPPQSSSSSLLSTTAVTSVPTSSTSAATTASSASTSASPAAYTPAQSSSSSLARVPVAAELRGGLTSLHHIASLLAHRSAAVVMF